MPFCCSVPESCLTLCNPMDCNTSDFPVSHHPLEFAQTHVHSVSDAIQPSHPPSSSSPPMSQFFESGGQSTGASASASVLPMNIQGWFPLQLTGLISLLSKTLSRVFSSTQYKSISSSALGLFYNPALTSVHFFQSSSRLNSSAGLYWGGIKGGSFQNQSMCQCQACANAYRRSLLFLKPKETLRR